jgi:hypothetical protein
MVAATTGLRFELACRLNLTLWGDTKSSMRRDVAFWRRQI